MCTVYVSVCVWEGLWVFVCIFMCACVRVCVCLCVAIVVHIFAWMVNTSIVLVIQAYKRIRPAVA